MSSQQFETTLTRYEHLMFRIIFGRPILEAKPHSCESLLVCLWLWLSQIDCTSDCIRKNFSRQKHIIRNGYTRATKRERKQQPLKNGHWSVSGKEKTFVGSLDKRRKADQTRCTDYLAARVKLRFETTRCPLPLHDWLHSLHPLSILLLANRPEEERHATACALLEGHVPVIVAEFPQSTTIDDTSQVSAMPTIYVPQST